MTPAAKLKEEVVHLCAIQCAALVAALTLLLASADGTCLKSLCGDSTVSLRHRRKL